MSDDIHDHDEDRTILATLKALERGLDSLEPAARPGDAGETLARLYTETLGLIPFALDPVAPSAAVRERLMALATGDETQEMSRPAPAPPLPTAPTAPAAPTVQTVQTVQATPTVPRPGRAAVAGSTRTPFPPLPIPPRPRAARRWPLALAAGLVLALLGVSGKLYMDLRQQSGLLTVDATRIDQLERELAGERLRSAQISAARADVDSLRSHFAELEKMFSLVTSPTVEMSALRPTGQVDLAKEARGRLYIAEDHQHWYLSVEDLQPSGKGRQYELWFYGDQGPVSGGTFTAEPGQPVHLSSETMPLGTKAILITLEPASGVPAPSGPTVLRGMPPVKVL
ncbi:MAG TPA: anti-sigma factor [Gemmatimonadales bacterium]